MNRVQSLLTGDGIQAILWDIGLQSDQERFRQGSTFTCDIRPQQKPQGIHFDDDDAKGNHIASVQAL